MELILITGMLSLINLLLVQQMTGDTTTVPPESVERILHEPPAGPQSLQEALWGRSDVPVDEDLAVDYR